MKNISLCFITGAILTVVVAKTPEEWKSRTIYQILTDRFASTQINTNSACVDLTKYCGGNYAGLITQLDYISAMGFDAIWISPLPTNLGDDYHGYAFLDLYTPNPNFGSEADLIDFIAAAHSRDIWVMLDVVGNHVAPVDLTYDSIVPFNESSYYHSKCQIEDWNNQYEVEHCRLANLPDLDQDNSYVRSTMLEWIGGLTGKYSIDGFRVDTVPEVDPDFWSEWNEAAGAYCVGEVFNGDISYVSRYQNYLDGILNYPAYYAMNDAFVHQNSMLGLQALLGSSGSQWNSFKDPSLLGTFVDNHDNPRFLYYNNNWTLLKNALALTLFTTGIPIVYYGSEQGYSGGADPANRESLWPNYDTSHELYVFLQSFVAARKKLAIYSEDQVERYATADFYAFSRGSTLICLTNSGGNSVSYTVSYLPYNIGDNVCNVIDQTECYDITSNGLTVTLSAGEPKIFTLV